MVRRDKAAERTTALTRIDRLMARARAEALGPDPDLADRYARLAQRIAMRYQTSLPPAHRASLCRACGTFRAPGRTARTRIQRGRLVTTCLRCGDVRRRPLHGARPQAAGHATAQPTRPDAAAQPARPDAVAQPARPDAAAQRTRPPRRT